jgi:hypothetical protein
MRTVAIAVLGTAVMLCGCAGDRELLSQVPQQNGVVQANYQQLASCAARKLDTPGLKKTDLPPENVSKLAVDSSGIRYWEATFRGTGPSTTEWSVTATNTLWGAFPKVADAAAAAIQQCGNDAPAAGRDFQRR